MKFTYREVNFSLSLFCRLLFPTSEDAVFENVVTVFGNSPIVVFAPWSTRVAKNLKVQLVSWNILPNTPNL